MLVDTSVLVRTFQPHHPFYPAADRAIRVLPQLGRKLHVVAQNLIELWVVATRPLGENGLGLTPADAATELIRIKSMFLFLPETPAIYPAWEALVLAHRVSGKASHDARLVAAMQVHGLAAILTFDRSGFSRFPAVEVVHPDDMKVPPAKERSLWNLPNSPYCMRRSTCSSVFLWLGITNCLPKLCGMAADASIRRN